MSALGVALLTFAAFMIVGLGVTALLPASFSADRRIRIAPGIGIGSYVVVALALSRGGLPVRSFAIPMTVVLLVAAIAAVAWRPVRVGWKTIVGVVGPVAIACLLVGSPLMTFGFHWVSYANDDMANYCLSAQRFQDFGYYATPNAADYLNDRNISEAYYGLDVAAAERTGSNLLLAVEATDSGHNPFEVFMPFIFAAFLTIVVGAGSLVNKPAGPLVPGLTSSAVALSPLAAFGGYYQLLGQQYGLAACCGLLGLVFVLEHTLRDSGEYIRTAVVLSLAACGLLAIYPELVAFVVLATGLWVIVRRGQLQIARAIGLIASAIAGVAVLLNGYGFNMIMLIFERVLPPPGVSQHVLRANGARIFPFYLIPSGLDNFWGIQPIAVNYRDPDQSILIALGLLLSLLACIAVIAVIVDCDTLAAPMFAALISYGAYAALEKDGFPLYKLAMYAQPFMIATVFAGAAYLSGRLPNVPQWSRRAVTTVPLLIAFFWLPTLAYYREASMDRHAGLGVAFEELKGASVDRILVQLGEYAKRSSQPVISDTSNISLAKIEAGYFRKNSLFFPASDVVANFPLDVVSFRNPARSSKSLLASLRRLQLERDQEFRRKAFNFTPGSPNATDAEFVEDRRIDAPGRGSMLYLSTDQDLSVLNRRELGQTGQGLSIGSQNAARDRLIFVSSSLGYAPGPGSNRTKIGLYQLEPDFYFHGRTMSSVGRFLLFRINRPSGPIRLFLDVTASLNNDARNQMPPAKAIGTKAVSFHAVGSGSGRLVSDPVAPVIIGHAAFVGLDLGEPHTSFEPKRTGLMLLYGRSTKLDSRTVVGFVRDISAIPAGETLPRPPAEIARFPDDLEANNVVYSGIYEDGWFGRDVRLDLSARRSRPKFSVRIVVPRIADANFSTSVEISIDGARIGSWPAPLGGSDISVPTALAAGTHEIDLHFSDVQQLPGIDRRPVAAQVRSIGFD